MFAKKGFILGFIALAPYVCTFAVQVFFANKLSIVEVGIFASINIFLSLLLAISNWNGDKLIISKQNVSNEQIDEIFTFELFYCLGLYLVTLVFFQNTVNSVLGLENSSLFWIALGLFCCYNPLNRSRAILEKNLSYFAAYSPLLIANVIGGILGVVLVFKGFGLWSMVAWKMSVYLLEIIILLFISPYRPKIRFSLNHIQEFLSYCSPVILGGALSFLVVNLDYIIVTSLMGERELGIYWLAFSLSHLLIVFRELIARFILPLLAKEDFDEGKLLIFGKLNGVLQILGVFSAIFITYWSEYVFKVIFTEKWIESVPIFILLYYAALYKLIGGVSSSLLFSAMKTRIALNTSVVNLFILAPIIFIAIKYGGLTGAAAGVLISTILLTIYVFETAVRQFCNLGFLYYFSYLSINIALLLFVYIFTIEVYDGIRIRTFYTFVSVLFAIITMPINKVLKRIFGNNIKVV